MPVILHHPELILAKLSFDKKKPVYVCSFYRLPGSNTAPLLQLNQSLNRLCSTNDTAPNIVLAGDY